MALALVSLLAAQPVLAHEFWLMPMAFRVDAPSLLRVQTLNGERFRGSVLPRHEEHIRRFEVLDPTGTTLDVLGRSGHPVSMTRVAIPGMHRVVYESVENPLTLEAKEFEKYLFEERLSDIIDTRAELGETDSPGREVYVRCAKSLVVVGATDSDEPIDTPSRLPLEIVLQGTRKAEVKNALTAVVLFDETPAPWHRVVAISSERPDARHELYTDADGMITFVPEIGGAWLLTTITMKRLEDRGDADWKSWWSSVTFEVADDDTADAG
ncbi:MAG: DUF4198 domain-containing protein [Planctomycetota bacterium]